MLRKLFSKKATKGEQPEERQLATTPTAPLPARDILVVEDEGQLSGILQQYLESHAFRVTCVASGVDGLKKVMAQDFDAIVCDMLLPTLPGDMFYMAVQKVKPKLCSRFIFMTGHKGDKKIDDFIRSVRGVMLWKPLEPHELLRAINTVIEKTD